MMICSFTLFHVEICTYEPYNEVKCSTSINTKLGSDDLDQILDQRLPYDQNIVSVANSKMLIDFLFTKNVHSTEGQANRV